MPDVQAFRFEDDGETPNNPRLPLVVYRAAVNLVGAPDPAAPCETSAEPSNSSPAEGRTPSASFWAKLRCEVPPEPRP